MCSIAFMPWRGRPYVRRASAKMSIAVLTALSPMVWMRVAMPRRAASIT